MGPEARHHRRLKSLAAVAASAALAIGVAGCGDESDGGTAARDGAPRATTGAGQTTPAGDRAERSSPTTPKTVRADADLRRLERRFDTRLGIFAVDTGTGLTLEHRAGDRFAFNSTIKALMAGVLLRDRTDAQLDRLVRYSEADLETYAPIAKRNLGRGMTVRALASAAVRYSDNTAANLLFEDLGGPAAFQRRLREAGDRVTRSNRDEPELSEATPGDERDTTTPEQLARSLETFALGDELPAGRRATLVGWLRRNTTGDALIRAGAPDGWTVGDKTGSGGYGSRNDVAILWPPSGGAPVELAILSTRDAADEEYDDALIAQAARVVLRRLVPSAR